MQKPCPQKPHDCLQKLHTKTFNQLLTSSSLQRSYKACTIYKNKTLTKMKKLFIALLIPQLVGALGSMFTMPNVNVGGWYSVLHKPAFNPPSWVFSPVWVTLFVLMGIALYWVWKHGIEKKDVKTGMWLFAIQLFLNLLWSGLFFGLHDPFLAFIDICLLLVFIILTIFQFQKVSVHAGLIMLPYLFWVGFATILNYHIWILNI